MSRYNSFGILVDGQGEGLGIAGIADIARHRRNRKNPGPHLLIGGDIPGVESSKSLFFGVDLGEGWPNRRDRRHRRHRA
jgi:hypothetical protein